MNNTKSAALVDSDDESVESNRPNAEIPDAVPSSHVAPVRVGVERDESGRGSGGRGASNERGRGSGGRGRGRSSSNDDWTIMSGDQFYRELELVQGLADSVNTRVFKRTAEQVVHNVKQEAGASADQGVGSIQGGRLLHAFFNDSVSDSFRDILNRGRDVEKGEECIDVETYCGLMHDILSMCVLDCSPCEYYSETNLLYTMGSKVQEPKLTEAKFKELRRRFTSALFQCDEDGDWYVKDLSGYVHLEDRYAEAIYGIFGEKINDISACLGDNEMRMVKLAELMGLVVTSNKKKTTGFSTHFLVNQVYRVVLGTHADTKHGTVAEKVCSLVTCVLTGRGYDASSPRVWKAGGQRSPFFTVDVDNSYLKKELVNTLSGMGITINGTVAQNSEYDVFKEVDDSPPSTGLRRNEMYAKGPSVALWAKRKRMNGHTEIAMCWRGNAPQTCTHKLTTDPDFLNKWTVDAEFTKPWTRVDLVDCVQLTELQSSDKAWFYLPQRITSSIGVRFLRVYKKYVVNNNINLTESGQQVISILSKHAQCSQNDVVVSVHNNDNDHDQIRTDDDVMWLMSEEDIEGWNISELQASKLNVDTLRYICDVKSIHVPNNASADKLKELVAQRREQPVFDMVTEVSVRLLKSMFLTLFKRKSRANTRMVIDTKNEAHVLKHMSDFFKDNVCCGMMNDVYSQFVVSIEQVSAIGMIVNRQAPHLGTSMDGVALVNMRANTETKECAHGNVAIEIKTCTTEATEQWASERQREAASYLRRVGNVNDGDNGETRVEPRVFHVSAFGDEHNQFLFKLLVHKPEHRAQLLHHACISSLKRVLYMTALPGTSESYGPIVYAVIVEFSDKHMREYMEMLKNVWAFSLQGSGANYIVNDPAEVCSPLRIPDLSSFASKLHDPGIDSRVVITHQVIGVKLFEMIAVRGKMISHCTAIKPSIITAHCVNKSGVDNGYTQLLKRALPPLYGADSGFVLMLLFVHNVFISFYQTSCFLKVWEAAMTACGDADATIASIGSVAKLHERMNNLHDGKHNSYSLFLKWVLINGIIDDCFDRQAVDGGNGPGTGSTARSNVQQSSRKRKLRRGVEQNLRSIVKRAHAANSRGLRRKTSYKDFFTEGTDLCAMRLTVSSEVPHDVSMQTALDFKKMPTHAGANEEKTNKSQPRKQCLCCKVTKVSNRACTDCEVILCDECWNPWHSSNTSWEREQLRVEALLQKRKEALDSTGIRQKRRQASALGKVAIQERKRRRQIENNSGEG